MRWGSTPRVTGRSAGIVGGGDEHRESTALDEQRGGVEALRLQHGDPHAGDVGVRDPAERVPDPQRLRADNLRSLRPSDLVASGGEVNEAQVVTWIRPLRYETLRCVAGKRWGVLTAEVQVGTHRRQFRTDIEEPLGPKHDARLAYETEAMRQRIQNWVKRHTAP